MTRRLERLAWGYHTAGRAVTATAERRMLARTEYFMVAVWDGLDV